MRSLVCGIVIRARVVGGGGVGANRAGFFRAACQGWRQIVVRPGDGVEVGGRLTKISPSELSIDGYTFTPAEAVKIEKSGDPIWNGTAIGDGVGALFGDDHRLRGVPARLVVALCQIGRHQLRAAWRAHRLRAPGTEDDLQIAIGRAAQSAAAGARHRPRKKGVVLALAF